MDLLLLGIKRSTFIRVCLIGVLLLAAFVRLWRIDEYMTFLGDEGRDARVVWKLLYDQDLVFIGPMTSVTTAEGHMFLGPAYYYLMAPGMFFAGGSPVGAAAMVALLGILTVYLLWDIGQKWFGQAVGLLAAFMYALSPTVIIYSRSSWNPNVMPLFALMAMWSAYSLWRTHKWSWVILWSIAINMALQSHYLGLLLIPGTGIWIALAAWQEMRLRNYRFFAWIGSGVLITILFFVPLILFDIKHEGVNFKAIMAFFTNREQTVNLKFYTKFNLVPDIAVQIFTRLLFLNIKQTIIPVIVLLGSLLVSALWIFKKTKERGALIALWIWFAVGVIGLSSYKQHIYDHYFGFLFPVPFLIVAWMIVRLWRGNADCAMCVYLQRFWGGAIFLMTVYLMYIHNPLHQAPNQQYSKVQQTIDAIMQHAGTRSFNFALLSKQNYDEGYRFAFESKHAQLIALDPSQTASITELLYVVCENSDLPNAPEDEKCKPIGHPQAEIAGFGWARIASQWRTNWGHTVYVLEHYTPEEI